uniref:Dynamin N-terminal domain-containing protein n=1 Tax=Arundo donax TaxID=35708 RepID=A0A0A9DQF3_ARUDO
MGFQFNHVGGGTKTRRLLAGPADADGDDAGVAGRPMPLADIQAYIEAENLRLENDPCQFSEKEIIIKVEYKHCPNLTIIDTPSLILPAPGDKNRVLQSQACLLRALFVSKSSIKRP